MTVIIFLGEISPRMEMVLFLVFLIFWPVLYKMAKNFCLASWGVRLLLSFWGAFLTTLTIFLVACLAAKWV